MATSSWHETKEAQAQVGFADRILISKTDLANEETVEALRGVWSR